MSAYNDAKTRRYRERKLAVVERCLARGHTREAACAAARLSRSTLWRWLQDDDGTISTRLELAEGLAEREVTDMLIRSARRGSNTAQIFWLKARRGWRDVQRVEHVDATPVDPFIVMDASERQQLEQDAARAREEIDKLLASTKSGGNGGTAHNS